MYNLKMPTSTKLRAIAIYSWCFMSYFVIGLFIDSTGWTAFVAIVSSASLLYVCFCVPLIRKLRFCDKLFSLGTVVDDKPTADEFTQRRGWICGYGLIGRGSFIMAWQLQADGVVLKFYFPGRNDSIKLDWKVIRQMIIFPGEYPMVELVIDGLESRLLLPYDFEQLAVPDSVSLLHRDDLYV